MDPTKNSEAGKTSDRIADAVELGVWCVFLLLCTLQFVPWYQWMN